MTIKDSGTRREFDSSADEITERIARYYGMDAQGKQTIEECAELIVAINHYFRCPDTYIMENVSEEMADVKIMIRQMEILLNNSDAVNTFVTEKLDRQVRRIENG